MKAKCVTYIVQVSGKLLDVLLQLVCSCHAILEKALNMEIAIYN